MQETYRVAWWNRSMNKVRSRLIIKDDMVTATLGVLFMQEKSIPVSRIVSVNARPGMFSSAVHIGDGASDSAVVFNGLKRKDANAAKETIMKLIGKPVTE